MDANGEPAIHCGYRHDRDWRYRLTGVCAPMNSRTLITVVVLCVSATIGFALARAEQYPTWGVTVPAALALGLMCWMLVPPGVAALAGCCCGTVFFLALFDWALTGGGAPSWAAVCIVALIESLYFAAVAVIARYAHGVGRLVDLAAIAGLVSITEYARTIGAWALPYGELGTTQSTTVFAALAPFIGTLGIGFLLALVAAIWASAAAGALQHRNRRSVLAGAVGIAAIVCVLDAWHPSYVPIRPAGLQPAILVAQAPTQSRRAIRPFVRALITVARPYDRNVDIVALPETLLRFVPTGEDDSQFSGAAVALDRPIVLGTWGAHDGKLFNSARIYEADGHSVQEYDKRRLVPFGEFVPLAALFAHITDVAKAPFSAGQERALVHTRHGNVPLLICFEAAFSDMVREASRTPASYALVLVNNSWFADPRGLRMQHAIMSLRSRESGLDLVVTSTSGPSGVFHHDGDTAMFTTQGPSVRIVRPLQSVDTVYRSTGAAPLLTLCAFILALFSTRLRSNYPARRP